MTQINGWHIFYFRLFAIQLVALMEAVKALRVADPVGYKSHLKTKLLASIYKCINETVPAHPDHPDFRLGKTLGGDHTHWRRVKKGMPDRYRLFFRFSSQSIKAIVYVWFNDDDTLRKAGSKTDVYSVFRKMLAQGKVPGDISELLMQAVPPA
jgi:toxin YhaV